MAVMTSPSITQGQLNLINEIRRFWEQQVMWMRFFIISTIENRPDLPQVTERLYANSRDFFYLLRVFFGDAQAQRFARFLTFHMANLGQLLYAIMNNNQEEANRITAALNQNANEMALFFSTMNPFWEEEQWRQLLFNLVRLTTDQMVAHLGGDYAESISIFDRNEENAYNIADYLAKGIIQSFTL